MTWTQKPGGPKGPLPVTTVNDIRLAHMTAGGYTRNPTQETTSRTSVPPVRTLNQQTPIYETRRTVSADNRPIPIIYGEAQVGGQVFALHYAEDSDTFTVGYSLALGPVESIGSILLDQEAPPAGVTINTYTGTASQTADPLLAAAIPDYADDLPGVAYIVLQFASEVFDAWPVVVATVQGRQVYDPRTDSTVFSRNPALHLGDFLASTDYGLGYTVDPTALGAAADVCDAEIAPGEARRESFALLDILRPAVEWAEVLRAYASCFVVYRGTTAYLIADRPAPVASTFTASDIIDGSMRITRTDSDALPTVVQVLYTDTDSGPLWRERRAIEAALPAVGAGLARRVSEVRLPGITRHSQAYREAVERLNKLTLSDLEVSFETFDEAMALEVGDVIEVTHPYGLTAKALRLTRAPELVSIGRWRIVAQEYDAAAYSDEIITQPSTPDTTLPVNAPPAAPASLTLTEDSYQLQNGNYASRIQVSWSPSLSPFVSSYEVRVLEGSTVVWATTVDSTSVATSPLKELVPYSVEVRAVTPLYTGAAVQDVISLVGKTAIPDAPASLSGFEAGGEVRLSWPAATDLDAERYEIRYGATGGDWDSAQVLDRTDGLRLVTRDIPAGEWVIYVKTIDSINQYSTGAASLTITVTLDNDAFTAGQIDPIMGHSSITNIYETSEARDGSVTAYYANGGDTWSSMFPLAMTNYTNAVASYQTAPAAEWLSAELDLLQNQSGQFRGTMPTIEAYSGTVAEALQLKPDGGSYADGLLSQQAQARYARLKASGTALFKLTLPSGAIRADIIAREETGTGTSAASGATTITLSQQYAAARSLVITPQASAARSAVFDNIQLDNGGVTTFDVYIFDASGSQVATSFRWQWKGV